MVLWHTETWQTVKKCTYVILLLVDLGRHFYGPASIDRGHIVFWPVRLSICPLVLLSVYPCVRLFVRKIVYIGHIFRLVILRALTFHLSIPCDKTFLLVPSSRSSVKVKVKYQGHSFRENDRCGGISVSQTQLVCRYNNCCLANHSPKRSWSSSPDFTTCILNSI